MLDLRPQARTECPLITSVRQCRRPALCPDMETCQAPGCALPALVEEFPRGILRVVFRHFTAPPALVAPLVVSGLGLVLSQRSRTGRPIEVFVLRVRHRRSRGYWSWLGWSLGALALATEPWEVILECSPFSTAKPVYF